MCAALTYTCCWIGNYAGSAAGVCWCGCCGGIRGCSRVAGAVLEGKIVNADISLYVDRESAGVHSCSLGAVLLGLYVCHSALYSASLFPHSLQHNPSGWLRHRLGVPASRMAVFTWLAPHVPSTTVITPQLSIAANRHPLSPDAQAGTQSVVPDVVCMLLLPVWCFVGASV
jgi:hypothetical protein